MYEVLLQSPDRFPFDKLGEALQKALFSAMEGRPAAIYRNGELVWEFKADGGAGWLNPHRVIVLSREEMPEDPYRYLYEPVYEPPYTVDVPSPAI
jgi:hypothetical protein